MTSLDRLPGKHGCPLGPSRPAEAAAGRTRSRPWPSVLLVPACSPVGQEAGTGDDIHQAGRRPDQRRAPAQRGQARRPCRSQEGRRARARPVGRSGRARPDAGALALQPLHLQRHLREAVRHRRATPRSFRSSPPRSRRSATTARPSRSRYVRASSSATAPPFDAAAVKKSIDRNLSLPDSARVSELGPITKVEALRRRDRGHPPVRSVRAADRRPRRPGRHGDEPGALDKLGEKFGTAPVCVGAFKVVKRVPQNSIELEKDPQLLRRRQGLPRPDRLPHHHRREHPRRQPALR